MPLLIPGIAAAPPPPAEPPEPFGFVRATWTDPAGTVWNLMERHAATGVVVLDDGVDGLGAAPRAVTRKALATGGTFARWSYADERIITLPVLLYSDTEAGFLELRRSFTRAFTRTAPAAGEPVPGTLTVARADGTRRSCSAIYLAGLSWSDQDSKGVTHDVAVLQLVATDPWWYGDSVTALEFGFAEPVNYLVPYETVSPTRTLGAATVNVGGEVPVDPVWEIIGPATSTVIKYEDGSPSLTYGQSFAGRTVTIDVGAKTAIESGTGNNKIWNIAWATSTLFQLQPGPNDLLLSLAGGVAGESKIRLSYRPRWETA